MRWPTSNLLSFKHIQKVERFVIFNKNYKSTLRKPKFFETTVVNYFFTMLDLTAQLARAPCLGSVRMSWNLPVWICQRLQQTVLVTRQTLFSAERNVNIKDIMMSAGWSNGMTIQRYCHKPAEKAFNIGDTVLHLATKGN